MNALTIVTAVSGAIELVETGREIYLTIANLMDAAEKRGTLSGTEKREWVLAYAVKEIKEVFEDLEEWVPKITAWIKSFKDAYNALRSLF